MNPVSHPPAAHATAPVVEALPAGQAAGWSTYVVRAGDTLWDLARRYDTTVGALVSRNGLSSAAAPLHVGDRLSVPALGGAAQAGPSAATGAGRSYVVRAGDSLWDIAHANGIDIPTLVAANGLSASSVILPGQRLTIPGAGAGTPAAPARPPGGGTPGAGTPGSGSTTDGTYVVRPGDSLWSIASSAGVDLAQLLSANGLSSDSLILPGQRLTVPGAKAGARTAAKAARTAAADTTVTWATVRAGDSLWSIAQRYGVSVTTLVKANGFGADHVLHPGDQVKVVGSLAPTAAAPTTTGTLADAAAANLAYLNRFGTPSRTQIRAMIVATARAQGVDPKLALAIAWQESRWSQNAVSEANAIGVMQCLPSTGQWVSGMVGRQLNLLDTQDNITCGVVLLRSLTRAASSESQAIAAYYQGLASVQSKGMYDDTKEYVAAVLAYKAQM